MTRPVSNKKLLFTRTLPALKEKSAYFSIGAIKRALAAAEIELADITLYEYMSQAMKNGVVSDAGRGWYSRHNKQVSLDPKPVAKIIRAVIKAFPILDFSCWSTIQFNPFALHLIAQPTILLFSKVDALESVAGTLREAGWAAWANPGKNEVERFVRPGEKTVVIRPGISKQPEAGDHVASIEKALVDLIAESSRLQLMDPAEAQRILDTVLRAGLIQLPVMLAYAARRGLAIDSPEIAG